MDAWIAANALRHDIPLLTHNRKHYEHPGLAADLEEFSQQDSVE
jgi:predicted nucleic acid-binding protein